MIKKKSLKFLKHSMENFIFDISCHFYFRTAFYNLNELKLNKLYRVNIPTYDGSGQAVHPSIIYNKREYILAFTPYRNTNDKLENPSIVVSNNGINFFKEKKPLIL